MNTVSTPTSKNSKIWRYALLAAVTVGSFFIIMSRDKISQDLFYHGFADSRTFLGIRNFFDVMSNLPFLIVGWWGMMVCFKTKAEKKPISFLPWLSFFVGIILVGPGSAYYHYTPNNQTLVWDRLPMTIGFMGLFVAMLSEYVHRPLEKFLIPFILLGFSSVIYWAYTDDLRFYFWVQFFPLLCIPVIMGLFPTENLGKKSFLLLALFCYVGAKITEWKDPQIFAATGFIFSGHSIKHLLAALAPICIGLMLKSRSALK